MVKPHKCGPDARLLHAFEELLVQLLQPLAFLFGGGPDVESRGRLGRALAQRMGELAVRLSDAPDTSIQAWLKWL